MQILRSRAKLALLVSILSGITFHAHSQVSQAAPGPIDARLDISTLPLWDAASNAVAAADTGLTVFYPQAGRSNGGAVVVAPGGSYSVLMMDIEGRQIADWFASRGFVAFVLKYRVGPSHPYPEPLQDGQRAIRLVRSMSSQLKIQPNKIGMAGFSAGGHLAAMVATSFDNGDAAASDPVQQVSDRPDFVLLGYPWLNAMQPNTQGFITYCSVMKIFTPKECKAWEAPYTPALHVSPSTPPTFIFSTSDDKVVPVTASVEYYSALQRVGASAELHVFRRGPHGAGLGGGDPVLDMWTTLLENWLRSQSFL